MDCSQSIMKTHQEEFILEQIHLVAQATGLFDESCIKVRITPYQKYLLGNKQEDFILVFANIMQGRTIEQKAHLSQ